ncbi:MAG: Gldg family protein, partial [Phaeodactylibacter sp.]|nr:Gldg family protein [Phaeodactylibacter sp.]
MNTKNRKLQSFIQLGLIAGILVFINILGNASFGGVALYRHLDLTEENRFTLTDPTLDLLHNLDEVVFVRVLLEGEFPSGFKRLQESTREMLDDYRAESGLLEYEFENVNQGTAEEINDRRKNLAEDGITPSLFRIQSTEGTEEKVIYPYAIFSYKGRTVPVNLLEEQGNLPQEVAINNSINLLEYKFSNAIQKLQLARKPIIAFTTGHGELTELQTKDLVVALRPYYELGRFDLDSNYQVPPQIDLLIIAKPTQPFSERDKFMIDQYIMNGGKTLWMLDKVAVSLDSLRVDGSSFVPRDFP